MSPGDSRLTSEFRRGGSTCSPGGTPRRGRSGLFTKQITTLARVVAIALSYGKCASFIPRASCVHSAHVLLLEASSNRIRYADALRRAGFLVTALADSETAHRIAVERQPRVIAASLTRANRDERLAFCRSLRADPRTQTIPTLLVSVRLCEEDIQLATAIGVLAIAVTPSDGMKLVSAIRGILAAAEHRPLRGVRAGEESRRSA